MTDEFDIWEAEVVELPKRNKFWLPTVIGVTLILGGVAAWMYLSKPVPQPVQVVQPVQPDTTQLVSNPQPVQQDLSAQQVDDLCQKGEICRLGTVRSVWRDKSNHLWVETENGEFDLSEDYQLVYGRTEFGSTVSATKN